MCHQHGFVVVVRVRDRDVFWMGEGVALMRCEGLNRFLLDGGQKQMPRVSAPIPRYMVCSLPEAQMLRIFWVAEMAYYKTPQISSRGLKTSLSVNAWGLGRKVPKKQATLIVLQLLVTWAPSSTSVSNCSRELGLGTEQPRQNMVTWRGVFDGA